MIRATGAYYQTLVKTFRRDIIPFAIIFSIICVSHCGALFFCLHGMQVPQKAAPQTNLSSNSTTEPPPLSHNVSSLADLFPRETKYDHSHTRTNLNEHISVLVLFLASTGTLYLLD